MKLLSLRRSPYLKLMGLALVAILVFHQLSFAPYNPYSIFARKRGTVPISSFFDGLEKYAVLAEKLKDNYVSDRVHDALSNDDLFLYLKSYLEGILNIQDETFEKLKQSHEAYVNEQIPRITKHAATFGELTPDSPKWELYAGLSGYVLIGGGKYLWLLYLVVKQIRRLGSTLPIEVFVPKEHDYEKKFCEEVLPRYNARCSTLDHLLVQWLSLKLSISGYQYKMLALLASSFENVLYLDLDLYPLRNVEYLFNLDLYKEKGLIIWPDNWARTTNPKFYQIAGVEVPERKIRYSDYDRKHHEGEDLPPLDSYTFENSHFHDFENTLPNPSSEAGVMLVNKTSHLKTLLLALYYNVYGPNFYYPLLTQGGAGEGDKETFIAAALVMDQPFFQTRKKFHWMGYHHKEKHEFSAKGLGHYDPVTSTETSENAPMVFAHCSYPKHYADWLYNNHDLVYDDGEHIRMWTGVYENVGYDLDLRLLNSYVEALCEDYTSGEQQDELWMGNYLEYVANDREVNKQRCSEVYIPHVQWLKETTSYPDTV